MTALRDEEPAAVAVVGDYLDRQVAVLRHAGPALMKGDPAAVHDARVAARRARCTLATFAEVLATSDPEPLLAELRWWGGVVGAVRDVQVLHLRWQPLLAELADVVAADAVAWLEGELGQRRRVAVAALRQAQAGDRHADLVAALVAAASPASPPGSGLRAAALALPGLVRRACRRMDRAARRVDVAGSEGSRAHRLHDVRKAAKRARYAAELCAPALGAPAADLAARMESVQEVLGERQDSAHAQQVLLELMSAPGAGGPEGFVCGALWSAEQQLAGAAEEAYPVALGRAEERAVRHWLG
ncbi:MAG: CHAD domain-containing protein [Oryzihumus sp.]